MQTPPKPIDEATRIDTLRALTSFARLLKQTFRKSDVLGRLGGDEFSVLLTNARTGDLDETLRRLRQMVETHNNESRRGYEILYSVRAVEFDQARHASVAELMAEADALMYERKKQKHSGVSTG